MMTGEEGEDHDKDGETDRGEDHNAMEDARRGAIGSGRGGVGARAQQQWRYFLELGLPSSDPALRVKSMFAAKYAWTAEEATPYLERFVVASLLTHDDDNDSGVPTMGGGCRTVGR
jgi:hypothetical protein